MGRFPTTFADQTAMLPELMGERGESARSELFKKDYIVRVGLTPTDARAIGHISQQESIGVYCPKDRTSARFGSLESTAKWLGKGEEGGEKGRLMFVLLGKTGLTRSRVAGYGWTGPEASRNDDGSVKIPGANITFAVRVGEDDQGLGLARPFTEIIVAATETMVGGQRHLEDPEDMIWLETWKSNKAAGMYTRAGFTHMLGLDTESTRVTADGEKIADIRQYMIVDRGQSVLPVA